MQSVVTEVKVRTKRKTRKTSHLLVISVNSECKAVISLAIVFFHHERM